MMNIPITKTCFDECEKEAIVKPLETGWVVQGPYVREFEAAFAKFCGIKNALATSNCTTALHLALIALGVKDGDKVIVPSFTYVASANAVEYVGAVPVFCDINLRTFNIDEAKIEGLIENDPSIKAIMPVNLFGLCADMPKIMEIAKKYGLKVVEDSACGFGASIDGTHSGAFGDIGCFSFHPRKAITTGEGGMLITNDDICSSLVSSLRDHGASKSDLDRHKEKSGSLLPDFNIKGFNYRMTDFQGAIGVCQMKKAETILDGRRKIANKYFRFLKDVPELATPIIPDGYIHGFQSFVCLFTGNIDNKVLTKETIDLLNIKRNEFMQKLEDVGVATRQGTHAVHTLGYYKNRYSLQDTDFLMSYAADRLSVTLPLYAGMSDEEFEYVAENIKKALA